MNRRVLIVIASGMWMISNIRAHEHDCTHSHPLGEVAPENSLCEVEDETCEVEGRTGNCKMKRTSRREWCACVPKQSNSSLCSGRNEFGPDSPGLPGPGQSKGYLAILAPTNGWSVLDGDTEVEFEAPDTVQGSFDLSYGLFNNPSQIPVSLVDVAIQLPPLTLQRISTGPNALRLRDATPVSLIYNSLTGVISPGPGATSIPLALDNAVGVGHPVRLWFEAKVLPDGRLDLYAHGLTWEPLSDIPTVGSWGLIALTLLLVICATVCALRRKPGLN